MSIRSEAPFTPLEISIFEGPTGSDSPPPGKEGGEPRPAPSAEQAKPFEAAKAPPATRVGAPPFKLVARSHPAQRTIHAERRVEEKGLPVALKTSDQASTV